MRARLCRFSVFGAIVGFVTTLMWSGAALAQGSHNPAAALLGGTIFLFIMGLALVCYVYVALALQTIASKTATPNEWLA